MSTLTRGSLLLALAALVSLAPRAASAQLRPPARVTVEGLFGQGTLLSEGYVPVVVTVENLTRTDFVGEVELVARGYSNTSMRMTAPMDLPAGQSRRAVLTLFADGGGGSLQASYLVDDDRIASGAASVDYAPGGRSVVVFGDPPRLRGALLDLDVSELLGGGPRQVRVPVGTVRFDSATGDPLLPDAAGGWSTVKVLVAHAPALERLTAAQRSGLEDWLRTGGRLVVFPRTEADLARPWLASLVGSLAAAPATEVGEHRDLVPDGGVRFELSCGEGQRAESFGCSAPLGLGRVFVASYDGTSPAAIESGAPRELVRSVYAAPDPVSPALSYGRGQDDLSQQYWTGTPTFGNLRAALDPNEGFRPALGLVALVLLLYVIVVGPLNFRWVQRRNEPTLALLTTPLAAAGCALLLLVVGYIGKGVRMRYRRVEVVEAVEGDARVPARRYTGLFATRPGSFDLPGPTDGSMVRRIGAEAGRGPVLRVRGSGVQLADFRAGLWETAFLREDRMIELDGALRFARDGRRLEAVQNDSGQPLMGAFVLDTVGAVYVVGDVAAHGRAPIPRDAAFTLSQHVMLGPDGDAVEELARRIGIDADHEDVLRGVMHLCGGAFVPQDAPVLYARLPARREQLGDLFAPELDQRWVRLVPRLDGVAVVPAPPPTVDDPWGGAPTPEPQTFEDEPPGELEVGEGDAGLPAIDLSTSEPAAAGGEP